MRKLIPAIWSLNVIFAHARSQKADVICYVSCMGSGYQVKEFGNLPNNNEHNYLVYNNAIGGIQEFPIFAAKPDPFYQYSPCNFFFLILPT